MVGLMDFFTGGDPEQMAQIDPRYGVPRSDVRDAAVNALANISATLLAAGQPIMPAQRAQILAGLGVAASGINQDLMNASQRRMVGTQMEQRRAEMDETRRLGELMRDPAAFRQATGFDLQQFGGMDPRTVSQAMRQIRVARLSNPLQEEAARAQLDNAVATGRLTRAQADAAEEQLRRDRDAAAAFSQTFPGLLGPSVPGAQAPAAAATSQPAPPSAAAPAGQPSAAAQPAAGAGAPVGAPPAGARPPGWVLTPEQEALLRPTMRTPADWIRANQEAVTRRSEQEGTAFTRENALRDEFNKRGEPFAQRQTAFRTMMDLARQGEGASDIALVLSLMKVYDPTSTVTGGEAATAQNAAGVPESIRAMFNTVTGGGRLSDTARQQLVNAGRQRFFQEMDDFGAQVERYTGLAGRYNLNRDNVVQDVRDPELLQERTQIRERTNISRRLTPETIGQATLEQLERIDASALSAPALQAYQRRRAELTRPPAAPPPAPPPRRVQNPMPDNFAAPFMP